MTGLVGEAAHVLKNEARTWLLFSVVFFFLMEPQLTYSVQIVSSGQRGHSTNMSVIQA